MKIQDLINGQKEVIEKTIQGDSSTYVMEIERTENGNLFYTSFSKDRNGAEINGSVTVNQRLDSESKKWWGIN